MIIVSSHSTMNILDLCMNRAIRDSRIFDHELGLKCHIVDLKHSLSSAHDTLSEGLDGV